MSAITQRTLLCLALLGLAAAAGQAVVHSGSGSPLTDRIFADPALTAVNQLVRVDDLPGAARASAMADLIDLDIDSTAALFERRGGRWGTLYPALPLIPGTGAGNRLSWPAEAPADNERLAEAAHAALTQFLAANESRFRLDVGELDLRSAVHSGGALVQFSSERFHRGLPVRGAVFAAVVNHGNLVLLGSSLWGDIEVDLTPAVSAEDALVATARYMAPSAIDGLREKPTLAILPTAVSGAFDAGRGYEHRLVWVVEPSVADDLGQWEALVDAHSGRLVSFADLNHYQTDRNVNGGIYPRTYDGIPPEGVMVDEYPMPFADLSSGGFADAGGNFNAAGNVTTTLSGQFIGIQDFCGAISESSTGDIELEGTDGDTDCVVPPGHSAGDTAAARTTFFHAGRTNAVGRAQLPANGWLAGQLTAQTNISVFCNAFWTGSVIQFFREAAPCANTGQLSEVINHEWGHGMDDNDVDGNIPGSSQGGGEGMADLYAALRQNQACIGRGFFTNGMLCGGYGDPCTPASGCTGIRSIDFADRTSGLPHTLTWVRANCGFTVHCLGAAYAEAVWDLLKRDLPAVYGMDNNTALEVTTRLTFIGAGNASGWFDRVGPPPGGAGCGATQAYLQYLAADDDDGNIANGTPHMTAIAAAFDRHEIGCTPAFGGPIVQDSGCGGTPTTAPTVLAVATDMGADLSWAAVPGASSYSVYRTDGVNQCDHGKVLAGSTTGLSFSDTGLKNEHNYYYVVTPMGPSASCFGPASPCTRPFTMLPVDPGTAGASNNFPATGATPGRRVHYYLGRVNGTSTVSVGNCPSLTLSIGLARRVGIAQADPQGDATLTRPLPGSLSGLNLSVQAVDANSCRISNEVTQTY